MLLIGSTYMLDTELLKMLLQLGMFGLWCIFIIWLLFYGSPMLRDILTNIAKSYEFVANRQAETQTTTTAQLTKDYREEMREMRDWMSKELEANRIARHKAANDYQKAIAEIYIDAVKRNIGENGDTAKKV